MNQTPTNKPKPLKGLRIIQVLRRINKNTDLFLYKTALGLLILITVFLLITVILQINWFLADEVFQPVLTWIVSQPFVGAFFIPFLFLLGFVATFVVFWTRPVTIKQVASDCRTLLENDDISENNYNVLYKELLTANEQKQQRIAAKNAQLLKWSEWEEKLNEKDEYHKQTTKQNLK